MRFVRAHVRQDTGELVNITEAETPLEHAENLVVASDPPVAIAVHDLGLAEHFDVSDPLRSPAWHLYRAMEREPGADAGRGFRAKDGHALPAIHEMPVTRNAILAHVKAKGPGAIHERAAHWLEYMGVLTDEEMDAHGLPRLTVERAHEFDAIRMARDPTVRAAAPTHARRIAEREALHAAKRES